MFDQWRADCSPSGDAPRVDLPNVQRVADRGVTFTRHFANAVPCGPARAGLFTGTYLHHHRSVANGTPLPRHLLTLGDCARDAGYTPTLFGYTDTSVDPRGRALDDPALRTYESILPGFDVAVALDEYLIPWGEWLRERGYVIGENVREIYGRAQGNRAAYPAEHTEAAFLTEAFLAWLDGRAPETAPTFFAHLSYIKPHPPYSAPKEYLDRINPDRWTAILGAPTREDEATQHPLVAAAQSVPEVTFADEDHLKEIRHAYLANLLDVDTQLGRALDALEEKGQLANTIVIVTADHADLLGDHHAIEKWGHFPSAYHVPLIIAGPDIASGGRVSAYSEHVDILPTICDLIGAPIPSQCDGHSLRPFSDGTPATPWRAAAHWEWDFRDPRHGIVEAAFGLESSQCNMAAIHDDAGTYAHYAGLPPVFYDRAHDPNESYNAATLEDTQPLVASYAARLLSWRLSSDDQTLTNTLLAADGPFNLPT